MSNEEKILSMLTKLQEDVADIKRRMKILEEEKLNDQEVEEQLETFNKMRHLLTKEEKDALGKYQEAEEARKAALYG